MQNKIHIFFIYKFITRLDKNTLSNTKKKFCWGSNKINKISYFRFKYIQDEQSRINI